MIGQTISHYKITAKLGEGGMGEVFLATDTSLDRPVALKFLSAILQNDPEARERLIREAKSASRLNHKNIMTIHAVDSVDGRDFLVMEFVEGKSLRERMDADEDWSIEQILRIALQICDGLAAAHKQDIVHRDIKPANVLVTSDGQVKIADFGLATWRGAKQLTREGTTVGTVAYMSPEQIQGKKTDPRSDLFSLGVVLYEMIARRRPFVGEHDAAISYAITNEIPEPLQRYKSGVHAGLEQIVARALEKDPATRYQSAADMLAELKRVRREIEGSQPSMLSRSTAAATTKPSKAKYIVASTAAVVFAAILLILKPWHIDIGPGQVAGATENRLAVMYFDNLADPGDSQRLGEIAANLLITDLSGSPQMQVVSSQRLHDLLRLLGHEGEKTISPDIATQVAEKAGARWMMTGSILKTEPNIVLTAQIVEVASGNTVASQRVIGEPGEDVFPLIDRLTAQVKQGLSIRSDPDGDQPVILSTTPSRDVYRMYLEAMDLQSRYKWHEALEKLDQVIAIDSTFAMAYYHAAVLSAQTQRNFKRARGYLDVALALSSRLNRADRSRVHALDAGLRGNAQEAVRLFVRLTEEYPDDKDAWMMLANVQRIWLNDTEASVKSSSKAVELDSLDKEPYNQLSYSYSRLGDYEKSLWAINKYISLAPDEPNPYDSRGELYGYSGRLEEATTSFKQALAIDPDYVTSSFHLADMYKWTGRYEAADSIYGQLASSDKSGTRAESRLFKSTLLIQQGKMREAIAYLQKCAAADELDGEKERSRDKLINVVELYVELGDTASALTNLREYISRLDSTTGSEYARGRWREVALLASQLNIDSAEALNKTLDHFRESVNPIFKGMPAMGDAIIASYKGDHPKAIAEVERALILDDAFIYKFYAAVIYLRAGQLSKAASHLESLIQNYNPNRSRATQYSAPLDYYLAIAYEQSGWNDKAIEHYERFLGLWGAGDPELVKVKDARVRLANLRS